MFQLQHVHMRSAPSAACVSSAEEQIMIMLSWNVQNTDPLLGHMVWCILIEIDRYIGLANIGFYQCIGIG